MMKNYLFLLVFLLSIASYDFTNETFGYLGKKGNKWYENVGYDKNGVLSLFEVKNGPQASFTPNQKVVWPQIENRSSFFTHPTTSPQMPTMSISEGKFGNMDSITISVRGNELPQFKDLYEKLRLMSFE